MEIWKDIEGYDGNYQVSNFGNVRSLDHFVKHYYGGVRLINGRKLKLHKNKYGYLNVRITYKGKKITHKIHLLVWDHFGDKPRKKGDHSIQVDHKEEENKTNNHIDNLQLLSNRGNSIKHFKSIKKSSKYVGVRWHKSSSKWISQIQIEGKSHFLGSYDDEYEAYLAYKKEVEQLGHKL